MSALPKIKFFVLYQNNSHSSLFYHFLSFKNIMEWNSQCKNFHSGLFKWFLLILSPYISLKCSKNDWMRVEWGIFLKQGKTLNSQISSILLSFQHSDLILAKKKQESYREAAGSNYLFDLSASLYDSHHEIEWLSNDLEWIWNDRMR